MEADEKVIILTQVWYYTAEVVTLMQTSKSKFEREIKPHRRGLGKKMGMRWTNLQVKRMFYLLTPHIQVIIE